MEGKQFSYWERNSPFESPVCHVCKHHYIKNTDVLPRRCITCNSYMVEKNEYEEFTDMAGVEKKLYCILDSICHTKELWYNTNYDICCMCCEYYDNCKIKCKNHPDRCNCYTLKQKVGEEVRKEKNKQKT